MAKGISDRQRGATQTLSSSKQEPAAARSAYIHIPFCRRRCYYCDFAISVVGDRKRGDNSGTIQRYIETLIREIAATPLATDSAPPLETIFFGGGTPSLLAVSQLEAILSAIAKRFGIAQTAEISMEMDPATFERSHLQGYRSAGINRVSLGAQDFHDDVLAASGRFHRKADILRSVDLLQGVGLTNFSLDLMSGLPHQTLESWEDSLQQAIALQPAHISQYDLIVEPQTAFSRYFTPGESPLPTDAHTAQMYRMAAGTLPANGYDHYEICNYTKPGYAAQHNITYWKSQPYYGFGMGATSYIGHQRIDRPRTQRTYQEWVERFVMTGGRTDDPVIEAQERVLEQIMVGLRLREGIELTEIFDVYGANGLKALGDAIAPHAQRGWVIIEGSTFQNNSGSTSNGTSNIKKLEPKSCIRLSDPEGFVMSNQVIVDAFNALEALENR